MRRLARLLTLLALGACASPTPPDDLPPPEETLGGVTPRLLTTDRPEYAVGDTARLVLRNLTDRTLGYNLCSSWWELWTGGAWREIHPLRLCTRELRILEPGQTATWEEPISAEWAAGQYRFGTVVYVGTTTATRAHTASFQVVR